MDSIDYYNKYAASVFERTVGQDMDDIRQEFLKELEEGATILDLGCGSGRDSLAFYELGYDVTPLDASEEMCKLARIHTGLEVLNMKYDEMEFEAVFDGIWACASFVHLPKEELLDVLDRLARALKSGGTLYMSFKSGSFEGFKGERYFKDYTEDGIREVLKQNGRFEAENIWETEDSDSAHPDSRWLNVLVHKR